MRLVSTVTTVHPHTYKHTPKHLQIPTHAPIYTHIHILIYTDRERERMHHTRKVYEDSYTVMFQRVRERDALKVYPEGT